MLELSDQDLLLRLHNFEDFFVERKTSSDKSDCLPTVVGFANSAPVGAPAVLFIGVRNDGTIENAVNLDELQKTFSRTVGRAYPPIPTYTKVLEEGGKEFCDCSWEPRRTTLCRSVLHPRWFRNKKGLPKRSFQDL
jgi:predicted HTH transcriptional regulator